MIRIEIETDNEAFGEPYGDEWREEVRRVALYAIKMTWRMNGADSAALRDSNGNTVGRVTVTEE
jgi:hypothetical protein